MSIAPPMRPHAATSTIVPCPVQGLSARSRRQEGESGNEAQSPGPSKSHLESLAKQAENVEYSAQSDDAGSVDDASPKPTSDDDDQGDFGFDQYGEGEDSNKPMDVSNDEGDIGERLRRSVAESVLKMGTPGLKNLVVTLLPMILKIPALLSPNLLIIKVLLAQLVASSGARPLVVDDGPQLQPIPMGKVFLFGSCNKNAHPHLSIMTQTDTQLPPILKWLSAKY